MVFYKHLPQPRHIDAPVWLRSARRVALPNGAYGLEVYRTREAKITAVAALFGVALVAADLRFLLSWDFDALSLGDLVRTVLAGILAASALWTLFQSDTKFIIFGDTLIHKRLLRRSVVYDLNQLNHVKRSSKTYGLSLAFCDGRHVDVPETMIGLCDLLHHLDQFNESAGDLLETIEDHGTCPSSPKSRPSAEA